MNNKNYKINIFIIFLIVFFPYFVFANVTVDSSTNSGDISNQTTASWSHTVSGSEAYLVVGLSGWDNADSLSNVVVTYAGMTMTRLGGEQSGGINNAVLWGLTNPPQGTNIVSISNIPSGYSELGGGSISFSGVNQSNPVGTFSTSQTSTASINLSSGDLGVDILYSGSGSESPIPGANETTRVNTHLTSNVAKWMMMGTEDGAGTVTMNWTDAGGSDFAVASIPILSSSNTVTPTPTPSPTPTPTPSPTPTPTPSPTPAPIGECSPSNIRCVGSGQEYTSIQSAVNATIPGDIVVIMSGTYSGFTINNSGTSGNKIIVRGYSVASCPTVVNSDPNSRGLRPSPTVTITSSVSVNASYVTVECLKVTSGGMGIDGSSRTNIDFFDNVLDSSSNPGSFTGFGISYDLATTKSQQPSFVNISRNYITRTRMGAWIVANNITYTDNEHERMTDLTGDGDHINLWGEDHLYRNNYFWGNVHTDNPGAHSDCWQTFNIGSQMGGDWNLRNARRITIDRNTCFHVNETIITSNNTTDSSRMTDWTVTNNILAFPRLNGGSPGGGGFGSTLNTLFYNNTVYDASMGCGRSDSTVVGTVTVKNNILYGSTFNVSANCNANQSNNLTGTGSYFVNSSSNNFRLLSGTSAVNSGATGLGVVVDRDNNTRDSQPDIGAYEYIGTTPTPTPTPVPGDLNVDHVVNSLDWSIMNAQWFTSNSQSDLRVDGQVNSLDFAILSSNWGRTW